MGYPVRIYSGDYRERQAAANADGAAIYLEQHVNSSVSESPDYGLAVVADNASQRSKDIGRWYAERAGARYDVGGPNDSDVGYDRGLRVGGRGNGNLFHTAMPAVILEPWFASNPAQAGMMNTYEGKQAAAHLLYEVVVHFVPTHKLVALSVGHIGKTTNPTDRGAAIYGGGTEAEWSMDVVHMAKDLLEQGGKTKPPTDHTDCAQRIADLEGVIDEVYGLTRRALNREP